MEKLQYCQSRSSNTGHCAEIAAHTVTLITRNNKENGEKRTERRCEKHKNKGTTKKCVIDSKTLDQSELYGQVNRFLNSLIGKNIVSSYHPVTYQYPFIGKYLKDNGGIMCYNDHTKKWKFVYYHQIQNPK